MLKEAAFAGLLVTPAVVGASLPVEPPVPEKIVALEVGSSMENEALLDIREQYDNVENCIVVSSVVLSNTLTTIYSCDYGISIKESATRSINQDTYELAIRLKRASLLLLSSFLIVSGALKIARRRESI